MTVIAQLLEARGHALKAIEAMEAASASDNADRSAGIVQHRREVASYDAQLANLGHKFSEPEPAKPAIPPSESKPEKSTSKK